MPMQTQPVICTDIATVGYDADKKLLRVTFHATGSYDFFAVPADVAAGLKTSDRPGKFFLQQIKARYAWEKTANPETSEES